MASVLYCIETVLGSMTHKAIWFECMHVNMIALEPLK